MAISELKYFSLLPITFHIIFLAGKSFAHSCLYLVQTLISGCTKEVNPILAACTLTESPTEIGGTVFILAEFITF